MPNDHSHSKQSQYKENNWCNMTEVMLNMLHMWTLETSMQEAFVGSKFLLIEYKHATSTEIGTL